MPRPKGKRIKAKRIKPTKMWAMLTTRGEVSSVRFSGPVPATKQFWFDAIPVRVLSESEYQEMRRELKEKQAVIERLEARLVCAYGETETNLDRVKAQASRKATKR